MYLGISLFQVEIIIISREMRWVGRAESGDIPIISSFTSTPCRGGPEEYKDFSFSEKYFKSSKIILNSLQMGNFAEFFSVWLR